MDQSKVARFLWPTLYINDLLTYKVKPESTDTLVRQQALHVLTCISASNSNGHNAMSPYQTTS